METALLTGSAGLVGRALGRRLASEGYRVRLFDLDTGHDLRDEQDVLEACAGCDVVVHAGAIPHDTKGTPAEIVATNVLGTWHVLLAAEQARVSRVVSFSSVQEMCAAWSERTGITTVVLRPAHVLDDRLLRRITPAHEDLGAFVHLDDVAEATVLALTRDVPRHSRMVLAGTGDYDTTAARTILGWRPTRGWPTRTGQTTG